MLVILVLGDRFAGAGTALSGPGNTQRTGAADTGFGSVAEERSE